MKTRHTERVTRRVRQRVTEQCFIHRGSHLHLHLATQPTSRPPATATTPAPKAPQALSRNTYSSETHVTVTSLRREACAMTVDEVHEVIRWLYAHRGHPDPNDPIALDAWQAVIGDLDKDDVLDVIVEHHRTCPGVFLMPSDIRSDAGLRELARDKGAKNEPRGASHD